MQQAPPAAMTDFDDKEAQSGFDLAGVLKRRKWIIALLTMCGAGIGYLFFLKSEPRYQSTAQLLLTLPSTENIPIEGVSREYSSVQTDVHLIRSPVIVDDAIETGNLSLSRGEVIGGLDVTPVQSGPYQQTNLLQLKFTGPNPDECADVLNAVIAQYKVFLDESKENSTQDVITIISDLKLNVIKVLDEQQDLYRTFRKNSPLIIMGGGAVNPHYHRLEGIETKRTSKLLEKQELLAHQTTLLAEFNRGASRESLMLMIQAKDWRDSDRVRSDTNNAISQIKAEEVDDILPWRVQEMELKAKLGKDHPELKRLQQKIRYLEAVKAERDASRLAAIEKAKAMAPAEEPEPERTDPLKAYFESIDGKLREMDAVIASLNDQFGEEEKQARLLSEFEHQDEEYRTGIAKKTVLYEALVDKLENIDMTQGYGGRKAQIVHAPGRGYQTEPNMTRILTIACVLGALLGFGLACLVEAADTSFRSPDDMMSELGLPLIGHIPFMTINKRTPGMADSVLDKSLCTYHRPKSRISEAYRAVRTALFFSTGGEQHKCIQITSPTSGDGKSTLSGNLSVAIANSGKRTLLLEADFRRPRVHKVFGTDNKYGVTSVITDGVDIDDAVCQTEVENLCVLTCGPRPHNPAELATSPEFERLLNTLRDKFDFVIVDTPPMLAVTDPSAVAPRVDGVILTLRLSKRTRALAKQSVELVNNLGGNLLGIVVNGVDEMDGYGYGSYRYDNYRYGYRSYGYGSNQGYEYSQGEEYYVDDASPENDELAGTAPQISRDR